MPFTLNIYSLMIIFSMAAQQALNVRVLKPYQLQDETLKPERIPYLKINLKN